MENLFRPSPEINPTKLIAQRLIKELSARGISITVAEGCSGGSILDNLTLPGSCSAFHLGGVFYSREAKTRLGVLPEIIDNYGEYSLETAMAMSKAVRKLRDDHLAIATVGDMDPLGNLEPRKVFLGFSLFNKKPWGEIITLPPGSREKLKKQLTRTALSQALFSILGQKRQEAEKDWLRFPLMKELTREFLELKTKAQGLIEELKNHQLKISVMESCTGGAIANMFTNIPGSSKVFDTGWVAYDENVKNMLGVPLKTMSYGVYTELVALEMAKAVLRKTGVDLAIATTGTMDTIDTRPFHNDNLPGTIYIAILFRERNPLTCRLKIKSRSREEMKIEITDAVFDLALEILKTRPEKIIPLHQKKPLIFLDSSSL